MKFEKIAIHPRPKFAMPHSTAIQKKLRFWLETARYIATGKELVRNQQEEG